MVPVKAPGDELPEDDTEENFAWVAEEFPQLDFHQLLNEAPEEPEWLVEDMLLRGRNYAVVAAAKAGKSLLMLDLACALAAGRSALGGAPQVPQHVVYLDIENTNDDISERIRDLGYEAHEIQKHLHYLSFPALAALDTPGGGKQVDAIARHYGADLVIVDTLSRVVSGDENEAHTYQAFYRHSVLPLKRRGVSVVRLDHLGKDTTKGARGSSAKADDVDAVWLLVSDAKAGRVTLELERQRSRHHPDRIVLDRKAEPLRHVPNTALPERAGRVEDALEAVRLGAGQDRTKGSTITEVALTLYGSSEGKKREQARRALDRYVTKGDLRKEVDTSVKPKLTRYFLADEQTPSEGS